MATVGTVARSIQLCSLEQLKRHLKIEDTSHNSILNWARDSASLWMENYCGRQFLLQTHTNEIHTGDGTYILYVNHPPVDPDTAVTVSFRQGDTWQSQVVTSLEYNDPHEIGELYWRDTTWPTGHNGIRVTYQGGYSDDSSTMPADLTQACIEICAEIYYRHQHEKQLAPSRTLQDGTTMIWSDDFVPRSARDVLDRQYRMPSLWP
jgi:uncharacterized phiE125 gp8 family phage protein